MSRRSRKKDLKNSTTYQDAYITQDYAKAIQQERRTLIKAMKKARALGFDSKVIDRHLFVNEERLTCGTIPEHLRGPAPKKRPMISGSKIESANLHLPSRGYRVLFKN